MILAIPTGIEASTSDDAERLELLDGGSVRGVPESPRFPTSDDERQRADEGHRAMLERAIGALTRALGVAAGAELDAFHRPEVAPNVIPFPSIEKRH